MENGEVIVKDYKESDKVKIYILIFILLAGIALFLFYGLNENNIHYNLTKRVPKVVAILITGGCIAFASVIFQTIINNRIITPSILGLDAMYGFVQSFVVFVFGISSIVITDGRINFIVSTIIMMSFAFILYKTILKDGKSNMFYLLLVGTVLGTFLGSLKTFMSVLIDPNDYAVLEAKLFASFSNVNTSILVLVIILLLVISIFFFDDMKYLDVMLLGRENAISLGVDYDKISKKFLGVIAMLISISTALVGPITFLSVIVVNLSYQFINSYKHKYVITASVLIGCIALIYGQFIVEKILNYNSKISIIINFVGGIYFIYLLLKENNNDRN